MLRLQRPNISYEARCLYRGVRESVRECALSVLVLSIQDASLHLSAHYVGAIARVMADRRKSMPWKGVLFCSYRIIFRPRLL